MSEISYRAHSREMANVLIGLAWLIGAGLWLFFYAGDLSIYQNLAILLVSLVPWAVLKILLKR